MLLDRAGRKIRLRSVNMTFQAWVAMVQENKKNNAILKRAAMKMKYKTVSNCFQTWVELAQEAKRMKTL